MTFTTANWSTPQNVSITGTEDANLISEADQVVTFTINDAGSDNDFDALADQTRNIDITDNDTAGFTIVESAGTTAVTEAGTTDTFTVVLNAQPSSDVVISVTSGDTGEATVDSSPLTFNTLNWNTPQTVTITGVDDFTID